MLATALPDQLTLPEGLHLLQARITLRLRETATLPRFKGALLRGAFGYAFQRISCPRACWGHSGACTTQPICPYRRVFETPHPPDIAHLHDLRDVPRPFVIEPPLDAETTYAPDSALSFHLILINSGVDFLPYFIAGFAEVARAGLGQQHARAHLEQVEVLYPWQSDGVVLYRDGQVMHTDRLPTIHADAIDVQARHLPADLRLRLLTPLRLKARGAFLEHIDPAALVRALCWRLNALSIFHGAGPWAQPHEPLLAAAQSIRVTDAETRWQEWGRTSSRQGRHMQLGGVLGSVVLRDVPPALRTLLLVGSVIHVGKACVFGHGGYALAAASNRKPTS
jgi:hypothetical protein